MRTATMLVLFLLLTSTCFAMDWSDTTAGVQNDKIFHFTAGAGFDLLLRETTHFSWLERKLCVVALGAGKEMYDRRHGGHFDNKDFIATVEGGLIADVFYIRF